MGRYLAVHVLPVVGSVLGLCSALDCLCYGAVVLPAWNFVKVNFLQVGRRTTP